MMRIITGGVYAACFIAMTATAANAGAPGARPGDTTARTEPAARQGPSTLPPARCRLKGSYLNAYSATITMVSKKKGTYVASYCGSPWDVSLVSKTMAGFTVHMTYTGTDGCGGFTEAMTWATGCASASGTFTDDSGGTGTDTWTRQ